MYNLNTILQARKDNKITEDELWDYLTALRGPDDDVDDTAKLFTTCIIRGISNELPDRFLELDSTILSLKNLSSRYRIIGSICNQKVHFLSHFVKALKVLNKLKLCPVKISGFKYYDFELEETREVVQKYVDDIIDWLEKIQNKEI